MLVAFAFPSRLASILLPTHKSLSRRLLQLHLLPSILINQHNKPPTRQALLRSDSKRDRVTLALALGLVHQLVDRRKHLRLVGVLDRVRRLDHVTGLYDAAAGGLVPLPGCILAGFVALGDSFAGATELEGGGGGFAVVAGW